MKATAARPGPEARASDSTVPLPHDLSPDVLLAAYRWMLLSRRLDEKEIQLKNQSQIFFQISGAGHEAMLVAAGLMLHPGLRLVLPVYRDRALCLVLGVTPHDMLLQAVGAKDDPASRGRQMPSHWGSRRLHIVSQGEPHGHAGPAGGRHRGGRTHLRGGHGDPRSRGAVPSRRGHLHLGRRRRDERGRVLGIAEHGVPAAPPGRVPGRGQRLRDLGAGRSADCRRRYLAARVDRFPHCVSSRGRRHGLPRELRRDGRGRGVRARALGPGARSRARDPAVLALALRRRAAVQDRRRSGRRRRSATRSRGWRACCSISGIATDDDLAGIAATVDREVQRGDGPGAGRRRSQARETAALWVFSPDVDPTRSAFRRARAARRASPTRWSPSINRTLHDEMRRDPRIVVFGEDVADCSRADPCRTCRARAECSR